MKILSTFLLWAVIQVLAPGSQANPQQPGSSEDRPRDCSLEWNPVCTGYKLSLKTFSNAGCFAAAKRSDSEFANYEWKYDGECVCPIDEGFFIQGSPNQCFKFWKNEPNIWSKVTSFCEEQGLVMAHPRDPVGLRKIMVTIYGPHDEPWVNLLQIDNTNNYRWQDDDTILPADSDLWFPGQPEEFGQGCVILTVWDWRLDTNPDQPYWAASCLFSVYKPLCELVLN